MIQIKKFQKELFEFWNLLLIFSIVIFIIQHIYFGGIHFQECDSSAIYDYLKDSSYNQTKNFIEYITPNLLTPLRLKAAQLIKYLPFLPIQKFFQIPYVSTYPPLMGTIFGPLIKYDYEKFYYLGSLINGFALVFSSIFLYLTCLKLKISKPVGFLTSTLLLTLYSTNAYSFHLGSTIWYIFSISAGIFLVTVKNKFVKDISSFFLQFLSYPYIVWILCDGIISGAYHLFSTRFNYYAIKSLFLNLFKNRLLTIVGIFLNFILFFPFNSGYRYGPDIRGIFTIFSFQPINNINDYIYTLFYSLLIYFLFFYGIKNLSNSLKNNQPTNSNSKFRNANIKKIFNKIFLDQKVKVLFYCLFFLVIFVFLVLIRKLTFTTTRHSLFIIPIILLIKAYGADQLIKYINHKKIYFFKNILYFTIIFSASTSFIFSNNSISKRIDVLKLNNLPENIVNFVSNNKNLDYSIIGCGSHYKYADFSKKKFSYDLKEPNKITQLYQPGIKLLISQRPIISQKAGEYNNEFSRYLFYGNPKKGDEINVYSKNVKISIISEPFISKTGVYYDALNKNSKFSNLFHFFRGFKTIIIKNFFPEKVEFNNKANKAIYDFYDFYSKTTGEEYRYPRPNDIWLIPVKIEKIN